MKKTIEQRKAELIKTIETELPKLKEIANKVYPEGDQTVVALHQDSFAADYQMEEYLLLGMAIKYLGLMVNEIRIVGTNRETLK